MNFATVNRTMSLDSIKVLTGICLQTNEFVNSLEESNDTSRVLNDTERKVIQNISQELNAALSPSDEVIRPIPPKDLKTTAKFMDVVAE